jgi:hypothetical protein
VKIKRRRQEIHTGLAVKGGGADKKVISIGAGIAIALTRAHTLPVGEYVAVLEYGEEIGRAVSTEEGASWQAPAGPG